MHYIQQTVPGYSEENLSSAQKINFCYTQVFLKQYGWVWASMVISFGELRAIPISQSFNVSIKSASLHCRSAVWPIPNFVTQQDLKMTAIKDEIKNIALNTMIYVHGRIIQEDSNLVKPPFWKMKLINHKT